MPAQAADQAREWLSAHKPDDDPELYARVERQLALYERKNPQPSPSAAPAASSWKRPVLIQRPMGADPMEDPDEPTAEALPAPADEQPEVTVDDIVPDSFGDEPSSMVRFENGVPVIDNENELRRDPTARNLSGIRDDNWRPHQAVTPSSNPMATRWWTEPTPDMVLSTLRQRPDLRQRLADDGGITIPAGLPGSSKLTEDDPLYQKAADILYAEEFDKMSMEGRGILRASQLDGPESTTWQRLGHRLVGGSNDVGNALGAGLSTATLGLSNTALNAFSPPGTLLGDEAARDQQTASPLLRVPAELAGAFAPGSLPSRLTGATARMFGRGGQIAGLGERGALQTLAVDTGIGAVSGGMMGGIQAAGADLFTDREMEMKETARKAIEGALLGGGLAAFTSLPGRIAGAGAGKIKERNPDIATLERGGGGVSPIGVSYPEKLNRLITEHKEGIELAGKKLTPEESLQGEIGPRYARAGSDMKREVVKEAAELSGAYYKTKEAKKLLPTKSLLSHAMAEYEASIGKGGRTLPGDKEKPWLQLAQQASIGIPMMGRKRRPNHTIKVLREEEAEKLFGKEWVAEAKGRIDMDATGSYPSPDYANKVFNPGQTGEFPAPGMPPTPPPPLTGPELTFAVVPRQLNAESMDRVIENFRSQLGEAKANRSAKQRSLEAAERAAREDRTGFKGNKVTGGRSWADTQFEMSQKLDTASDTLEAGGLPGKVRRRDDVFDPSLLTPVQRKKMDQSLSAYMGKDSPQAREAMRVIASKAGVLDALNDLATLKAGERVDSGQVLNAYATEGGMGARMGATGMARSSYTVADVVGTDAFDKFIQSEKGSKVLGALQLLRGATGPENRSGALKQAFSMRSGAMSRAASAQDIQNLQTLVDVAYLIGQHRKEWEMNGEE